MPASVTVEQEIQTGQRDVVQGVDGDCARREVSFDGFGTILDDVREAGFISFGENATTDVVTRGDGFQCRWVFCVSMSVWRAVDVS